MSRVSMSSSVSRRDNINSRQSSPINRLARTSSVSSLLQTSSSLHSLRNGQVTSFNPKINDAFPNYDKKGKSIMPVISLPSVNSIVPKSAATESHLKPTSGWGDSAASPLYKESYPLDKGNRKYIPSTSLSKATETERG